MIIKLIYYLSLFPYFLLSLLKRHAWASYCEQHQVAVEMVSVYYLALVRMRKRLLDNLHMEDFSIPKAPVRAKKIKF